MNVKTLNVCCSTGLFSSSSFRAGIELLLTADRYAKYVSVSAWEFAVSIRELRRCGLSENDLRLLIRMQLLEHAIELPVEDKVCRKFCATSPLTFSDQSCFVFTELGIRVTRLDQSLEDRVDSEAWSLPDEPLDSNIVAGSLLPRWDAHLRVLTYQGRIVKRFARPASNQALVLSAFEEESWPSRIDDPLVPNSFIDVRRRLCDTIKCLNQGQLHSLLRFRGDGSGEGIVWESVS